MKGNAMRGVFAIILGLISMLSLAQNDIQYQNKALKKVLRKADIPNFSTIKEISLEDSVNQNYNLQGKFFSVKSDVSQYKYIYTGRVNSCRAGGCSTSVETPQSGESEYFDYFILFDRNKIVQLVKVFNYQATHGYEITTRGWLKQFIGHDDTEPLEVNKNIDAISGATISVYAITFDVKMKTKILKSL